jgi:hypothetical protein
MGEIHLKPLHRRIEMPEIQARLHSYLSRTSRAVGILLNARTICIFRAINAGNIVNYIVAEELIISRRGQF